VKPKRTTLITWSVCLIVLPLELYGLVASKKMDTLTLIANLGSCALVFAVIMLLRRRDGEKIEKDERTMRLERLALSYSWMVSFFSVVAIMYFNYIELIRPTAAQALTLVALTMALSSFAARFLVTRKGDTE
jgi:hypothetical protein